LQTRAGWKPALPGEAATAAGAGISVDYPLTRQHLSTDQHDLELSVGSGGPQIELHTGSAGVHVEPTRSSTI